MCSYHSRTANHNKSIKNVLAYRIKKKWSILCYKIVFILHGIMNFTVTCIKINNMFLNIWTLIIVTLMLSRLFPILLILFILSVPTSQKWSQYITKPFTHPPHTYRITPISKSILSVSVTFETPLTYTLSILKNFYSFATSTYSI